MFNTSNGRHVVTDHRAKKSQHYYYAITITVTIAITIDITSTITITITIIITITITITFTITITITILYHTILYYSIPYYTIKPTKKTRVLSEMMECKLLKCLLDHPMPETRRCLYN